MAYDKVVDSSVLDAGLKAIADAIREKGGTSDNLAFPQAMAEAISAISTGGGSMIGGTAPVITGEFTAAEDITANYDIPIDHTALVVDGENWTNDKIRYRIAVIISHEATFEQGVYPSNYFVCGYVIPYYIYNNGSHSFFGMIKRTSSGYSGSFTGAAPKISVNDGIITIPFGTAPAQAGKTFRWIAWRGDLL